jgi:hypothetical protein
MRDTDQEAERGPDNAEPGEWAVVCWVYPGGQRGQGSALPRAQALAMRQIYERHYPDRRYVTRIASAEERGGMLQSGKATEESRR